MPKQIWNNPSLTILSANFSLAHLLDSTLLIDWLIDMLYWLWMQIVTESYFNCICIWESHNNSEDQESHYDFTFSTAP